MLVHPSGGKWMDSKGNFKEEIRWESNFPADEETAQCAISNFNKERFH